MPSFKKATINIGDRQRGRLKATSVIDCEPNTSSILQAIKCSFTSGFLYQLKTTENPYGSGGASATIVEKLENIPFDNLLKKSFHDFPAQ